MVSTMRDREVFLLAPGDHSNGPLPVQPASQGCILIVEDDAPTLRLERVLLEEEGYSVEVVASGEEAIEAVTAKMPALVLLDIGLPGMDGFTACQRIRELSQVPIIMVTGRDCLDDKVKGMNVGADDYVTKPFLTHELATRVKVVLRRAALENASAESGVRHHIDGPSPGPSQAPAEAPHEQPPDATGGPEESAPEPEPISEAPPADGPDFASLIGEELTVPPETDQVEQTPPESGAGEEAPQRGEAGLEGGGDAAVDTDQSQPSSEKDNQEPQPGPATDPTPAEAPAAPPSATVPADTMYEGTVKLTVTTLGPVSNLINFVSELRQNSQYRLLRLVANQHKEGMDIWLGLREPVPLLSSLMEVEGVVQVTQLSGDSPEDGEPLLTVLLE